MSYVQALTLETHRLKLVPFDDEVDLFHELNTNPFIRKFIWDDEKIGHQTASEILTKNRELFDEKHYGLWKIIFGEKCIGYCGLWFFFDEPQPQLIYAILEDHTKKGLATEAAQRIVAYARDDLKFDHLLAATDPPNTPSQNVLQSLGFQEDKRVTQNQKETWFYRIRFGN